MSDSGLGGKRIDGIRTRRKHGSFDYHRWFSGLSACEGLMPAAGWRREIHNTMRDGFPPKGLVWPPSRHSSPVTLAATSASLFVGNAYSGKDRPADTLDAYGPGKARFAGVVKLRLASDLRTGDC